MTDEQKQIAENEYAHFVISHIWQFAYGTGLPLKWTILDRDFKSVLEHYGIKWGTERQINVEPSGKGE